MNSINKLMRLVFLGIFIAIVFLPQISNAASGASLMNSDPDTILRNAGVSSGLSSSIAPNSNPVRGCRIPTDIGSLFDYALCLLDSAVVPFLIGIALVLFLAGVIRFVSSGDNEEARQGGRNMMMFGIISLFVMVSIWGFVNILSRSFFGSDSEIQSLPKKSTTVFKQ